MVHLSNPRCFHISTWRVSVECYRHSCWKLHDKLNCVREMQKTVFTVCFFDPRRETPSNTRGRYTPQSQRPALSESPTVMVGSLWVFYTNCMEISENTEEECLVPFVHLSWGTLHTLPGVRSGLEAAADPSRSSWAHRAGSLVLTPSSYCAFSKWKANLSSFLDRQLSW